MWISRFMVSIRRHCRQIHDILPVLRVELAIPAAIESFYPEYSPNGGNNNKNERDYELTPHSSQVKTTIATENVPKPNLTTERSKPTSSPTSATSNRL